MPKFKRKPTEPIEAVQWNGDMTNDVADFLGFSYDSALPPEQGRHNWDEASMTLRLWNSEESQHIKVPTGHWIIKGLRGEFYPCSEEVFERSYEPVEAGGKMDVAQAEVISGE